MLKFSTQLLTCYHNTVTLDLQFRMSPQDLSEITRPTVAHHPFLASRGLLYSPELNYLFCRTCKVGLRKSCVGTHLKHHKDLALKSRTLKDKEASTLFDSLLNELNPSNRINPPIPSRVRALEPYSKIKLQGLATLPKSKSGDILEKLRL